MDAAHSAETGTFWRNWYILEKLVHYGESGIFWRNWYIMEKLVHSQGADILSAQSTTSISGGNIYNFIGLAPLSAFQTGVQQ